jgi:hypothetical protein
LSTTRMPITTTCRTSWTSAAPSTWWCLTR